MLQEFNELIAPLAQVPPIELTVECSNNCGEVVAPDEAVTSDHYPDVLFCDKFCRADFYNKQEPEEAMYYVQDFIGQEDY